MFEDSGFGSQNSEVPLSFAVGHCVSIDEY
jgi:hypothetical protein